MGMANEKEQALNKVYKEKQSFRDQENNRESAMEAEQREKITKLKLKVETFCVNKNCSWMIEFLAVNSMKENQFMFFIPGHRPLLLCFDGSYGQGQWVIEPDTCSPGIPKNFNNLGEALVAAEKS